MGTFVVRVRERFEAAHHLRSYRGSPEAPHGHSWQVEVALTGTELDGEGMLADFVEVKAALGALAGRFDHADINAVPPFDRDSPTTEHLARWFHRELVERLPAANVAEVTVWEGPDCAATYREEDGARASRPTAPGRSRSVE